MSYDRYLAIRKPLRYSLIMCPDLCMQLVAGCWFLVFVLVSAEIVVLCQLHFCGRNYIDHFFCDFGPLVQLATSDTSALMLLDLVISILMIFLPFVFIIMTYVSILITILSIPSRTGRKKSFSTCTSHLMTVCTYYGTLITVYMIPSEENDFNINKFRSLLYVMVTPMMNPIIYSLRNQEVLGALRKVLLFVRKAYG
ncbi:olfactory receptor 6X1-like [Spea bombifrons]|uniref:olfactory receptor 6X1-like n=1 Tax=Spea bombifrons TaxID=233779 RepID=UPI00234A3573|nr:olfactory receptor 6X1-like [Spea bombifrons]